VSGARKARDWEFGCLIVALFVSFIALGVALVVRAAVLSGGAQ
jgi:hypothetical protein